MAKVALVKMPVLPEARGAYAGNLGISYISSFLKGEGHEVFYFDQDIDKNPETLEKRFADFRPEFVGVTVTCDSVDKAGVFIKENKARMPGAKWIVGGPESTQYPRHTLEETGADFGVIGDGIPTIQHIIDGNIDREGIVRFHEGEFYSTGMAHYDSSNWKVDTSMLKEGQVEYPVLSSHGCNRNCSFCGGRNVVPNPLKRKIEDIIQEMTAISSAHSEAELFFFNDENFLMYPGRMTEILAAMEEAGLKQTIAFQASADYIIREREGLMAAKGRIHNLIVGAESFVDAQLRRYGKGTTASQNHEALEIIRRVGVKPSFFLIVGDTGTTIDELCEVAGAFAERPEYLMMLAQAYVMTDPNKRYDDYPETPNFVFRFKKFLNEARKGVDRLSLHLSILAYLDGVKVSDARKDHVMSVMGFAIESLKKLKDGSASEEEIDNELIEYSTYLSQIMNHLHCVNHVLDIKLEKDSR